MILIGEKINSSIPSVGELMKNRNLEGLQKLVETQAENGADYIDINTALSGDEENLMKIIAGYTREKTDCGVMLDSPDSGLLCRVLPEIKNDRIILNSAKEDANFGKMCEAALSFDVSLVAMPTMGMGQEKTENALRIAKKLTDAGIKQEKIFLDICVESIAVNSGAAMESLNILKSVKNAFPEIRTTCGLSNISFGLPKRAEINGAFLSMAVAAGLDSAILDVNSQRTMFSYRSAEAILGRDDFCMDYMEYFRKTQEN